jgi:hypothetical protein
MLADGDIAARLTRCHFDDAEPAPRDPSAPPA